MAKSVGTSSEEPAPTGVLYILNALAFSTLLSSQETDAHLWRNLRSPPGQPLNFTLESPSCQLRLPEATRKLKPHGGSSRHQGLTLPSAWSPCGHTRDLGRKFLAAPRVPVRLPAFRPPRGKMNFTGDEQRRQIGIPTPPAYRF